MPKVLRELFALDYAVGFQPSDRAHPDRERPEQMIADAAGLPACAT